MYEPLFDSSFWSKPMENFIYLLAVVVAALVLGFITRLVLESPSIKKDSPNIGISLGFPLGFGFFVLSIIGSIVPNGAIALALGVIGAGIHFLVAHKFIFRG
jgi:hypothetical protein